MSKLERIPISSLKSDGPIRHANLPDDIIRRILAFKKVLAEVDDRSLDDTINDFKKESRPEREVLVWESITEVYKERINQDHSLAQKDKEKIFSILLFSSFGPLTDEDVTSFKIDEQFVRGLEHELRQSLSGKFSN